VSIGPWSYIPLSGKNVYPLEWLAIVFANAGVGRENAHRHHQRSGV